MAHVMVLFFCAAALALLPDPPVVGFRRVSLSNWTLSSAGQKSFPASVPGDLVSDLVRAGIVPEPHVDHNWLTHSSVWWEQEWVYGTVFSWPFKSGVSARLVLDGVKMGARVVLNGKQVAQVTNQFLRYAFDVTPLQSNVLEIVFPAQVGNSTGIDSEGRFMACSGGWDWAMYGNHFDERGTRLQSRGIWKEVYVVAVNTLRVDSVVPVVYHEKDVHFVLNLTVHYASSVDTHFLLYAEWLSGGGPVSFNASASSSSAQLLLPVQLSNSSLLWAPRRPKLFEVSVCHDGELKCFFATRIGFRSVRLITHQSLVPQGDDATGNFTMRMEVNGSPVVLRGANWIPSSLFEGRVTAANLRASVGSAYRAGFNVLRVWGGGVYAYEDFLRACDEMGILIVHDMMLTSNGLLNPCSVPEVGSRSLLDEITHQIRRLASHASVVMYNSCNECGTGAAYMQVFPRILAEDASRVVWPSSPSNGWSRGVDPATGLFLRGAFLVPAPTAGIYIGEHEIHGPYLHGTGFPYVNDPDGEMVLFESLVPVNLTDAMGSEVGLMAPGTYVSEFGCVGMSSDVSMNASLSEASRDLHSKDMVLRNYPCDSLLQVYWGGVHKQWLLNLYACMVSQSIYLTGKIVDLRARNVWGMQIWQLNEIFPTGGWGTIETASEVLPEGQMLGGRWKPAHFALASVLYGDNVMYCGGSRKVECFVRRDGWDVVTYKLSLVDTMTGDEVALGEISDADVEPFERKWFCPFSGENVKCSSTTWAEQTPFGSVNRTVMRVQREGLYDYHIPLVEPQYMALPQSATVSAVMGSDGQIRVRATEFVAFVWMTMEGCQPEHNNFFLAGNVTMVIGLAPDCRNVEVARRTLRVVHAQDYYS